VPILGFQNYAQLEQVYSKREAQIIIDMPATQVYFKQKNFQEARDLSEAIGRTTVEEATVGDSGRVQESIQGRHLITPDELISLNKEVIVFTADTKPLKLPLTDPLAYEQALSYDPPSRDRHPVSEFVKHRGQIEDEVPAKPQSAPEPPTQPKPEVKTEPKPEPKPEPKTEAKPEVKAESKLVDLRNEGGRERTPPKQDKSDGGDPERRPIPKRPGAPDYDL
jgi:type IV secretory pathway TraG/TraD family ATPase VirD4